MGIFLMVLVAIVCLLLIGVILIQNSKGGGLATGFSSANQIGGVKRTADFLEKATWTLVITLMVLSIIAPSIMQEKTIVEEAEDRMEEQIQSTPGAQPQMPGTGSPLPELEGEGAEE